MSYQRFGTPKIYVDNVNWLLNSGNISTTDITTSGVSVASGSSSIELFDMKPSNLQTISANGSSDRFVITINTTLNTDAQQDTNFIAILGHNLNSAGAKMMVQLDDSSVFTTPTNDSLTSLTNVVNAEALADVDTGTNLGSDINDSTTTIPVESTHGSKFSEGDLIKVKRVGGEADETMYVTNISSDNLTVIREVNSTSASTFSAGDNIFFTGYTQPAKNGWSLATFTQSSDNQHIRIIFDPNGSNTDTFSSDIKIGAILIGETLSLKSPDLSISKSFSFEGVNRQTSVGGQTYANATYVRGANWFLEPFFNSTNTSPLLRSKTGRVNLNMNFSYMDDTEVYSENLYGATSISSTNSIYNNMIAKTNSGMFPMLFQYDSSTATDKDSFLWCRLASDPSFTQVANRVWNTSINLIEEF